jgi:hypothetical protein
MVDFDTSGHETCEEAFKAASRIQSSLRHSSRFSTGFAIALVM